MMLSLDCRLASHLDKYLLESLAEVHHLITEYLETLSFPVCMAGTLNERVVRVNFQEHSCPLMLSCMPHGQPS